MPSGRSLMGGKPSGKCRLRLKEGVDRWRQRFIDHLPHAYRTKLVNWCLQLSAHHARKGLATSDPLKVLVDNTVLGFGRTHETIGIVRETHWPPGGEPGQVIVCHRAPIDISQRYGSKKLADDLDVYEDARYLPGIAHLTRRGLIQWKTSFELFSERSYQEIGRYQGKKNYFDYWLFEGIKIESVDGYGVPGISEIDLNPIGVPPDNRSKQIDRVSKSTDPLYKGIVGLIGTEKNLDAWHIRTAAVHGMFCFLTMDYKLRRIVKQNNGKEPIASLSTKVMTPAEFGRHIGLSPIDPYICELAESDAVKQSARLRKAPRRWDCSGSSF